MTPETLRVPELFCHHSSSLHFSGNLASLRYTEQAPTSGPLHLLLPLLAHAPPHHSIPQPLFIRQDHPQTIQHEISHPKDTMDTQTNCFCKHFPDNNHQQGMQV